MANTTPANTPPATFVDNDNDEALLATARAQLEATQARIVVQKAHKAKEARQRKAWEELEREIEEFLAGNRDRVVAEHIRWVEEVREEYLARKRTVWVPTKKDTATKVAEEVIWAKEVTGNTPMPPAPLSDSVTLHARSIDVVIISERSSRAGKQKATNAGDGVSTNLGYELD